MTKEPEPSPYSLIKLMKKLKNSSFTNSRLRNNNIEKIGWKKFQVIKRLESALLWGKEIDWLQKKLYGESIILKKLKQDLRHSK